MEALEGGVEDRKVNTERATSDGGGGGVHHTAVEGIDVVHGGVDVLEMTTMDKPNVGVLELKGVEEEEKLGVSSAYLFTIFGNPRVDGLGVEDGCCGRAGQGSQARLELCRQRGGGSTKFGKDRVRVVEGSVKKRAEVRGGKKWGKVRRGIVGVGSCSRRLREVLR